MKVRTPELSSQELVARTVRGDRVAFGLLYDRVAPDIQRFLAGLRLDLDHHRIEDAVQETFVRLHAVLARFDETRPLKPFVLGVARRVALELERRNRPARALDIVGEPGHDPNTEGELMRVERDALVARALVAMPAEQRALMVFRFVNELGMQEIADALDCSIPTARARLKEAAEKFQRELARTGITPEDAPL